MGEDQRYEQRLAQARSLMHAHGLDYIVVGPSADLFYLTGAQKGQSERLLLLILSQAGPAYLLLPAFEASSLRDLPEEVFVRTWEESDNPARMAASLIASGSHSHPGGLQCTVGVGDTLWSVFLLRLQGELPRAAFTTASTVLTTMRQIKSEEEIEALRRSGSIADQVFNEMRERPFTGRTETDIALEIQARLRSHGLTVPGLPIVASGPNGASPHHHTGERVIERSDVVVLDFGGTWQGYYSDITRTVFAGVAPEPTSEEANVYNLVATAQDVAVRAVRPGMACESLDAVARDFLAEAGYGEYFTHRLGHGIGLEGHEPPYLVEGNDTQLQPGMAFTIEPGLYLPGRFGVRVEDTVYLSDAGAVRLNNVDRGVVVMRNA